VSEIHPRSEPAPECQISVATSFLSQYEGKAKVYASYATFNPAVRGAQESATDWMLDNYVRGMYEGEVLTDFDQQTSTGETLFSLDVVLTSPDLAETIAVLKGKFGSFRWEMLDNISFSYEKHEENVMVKNIGNNNRTNITSGDGSPIYEAPPPNAEPTPQEKYRHQYTLLAYATGTVFLVALLAISLIFPNPTPSQLKVQASILALAAAGFATVVSGLMNITTKVGTQLAIGAGGALAVLVLFYLQNPAVLR
jgi:hypothetical protein